MTWTATIAEATPSVTGWSFSITYAEGIKKFTSSYQATALTYALIQQTARNEIARLEAAASVVGKLDFSVGQEIDLTIPKVISPSISPEQAAKAEWFLKLSRLEYLQRLVAAGVIESNDVRVTVLQKEVISKFLDEYI